jgi:tetratricopeptide (TPR) repeat protein
MFCSCRAAVRGCARAGFCLLLAVVASGSAVYAWQQLKTNEAFLSATLKTATEIVNTAVAQAEKYRVPRAATLELLSKAESLFDDMARYGRPTPELQYQKAWMLIQFARNYADLGDSNKQRSHAEEAYRLLAGLAAAKPNDIDYQDGLAAAYDEIGDVQVAQGDLAAALKSFSDGLGHQGRGRAGSAVIEFMRRCHLIAPKSAASRITPAFRLGTPRRRTTDAAPSRTLALKRNSCATGSSARLILQHLWGLGVLLSFKGAVRPKQIRK